MKRCLVLGWLVLTASLVGQVEHAPTVDQCQADQRLWLSQIEGDNSKLSFDVLRQMAGEMDKCSEVDPANERRYYGTMAEASAAMALRLSKFIERHQLWAQFEAEDAAGKR
jgi:hypothetical protein